MTLAKEKEISTVVIGHITKEGAIAGPKAMEHLVDAVVFMEGEEHQIHRLLRAVKNRFGPTPEVGVFEMTATGLQELENPSEVFLAQRPSGAPARSSFRLWREADHCSWNCRRWWRRQAPQFPDGFLMV